MELSTQQAANGSTRRLRPTVSSQSGVCALLWLVRLSMLACAISCSGSIGSACFAVLFLLDTTLHGPFVRRPLTLLGFRHKRCAKLLTLTCVVSALHTLVQLVCISREGAEVLARIGFLHVSSASDACRLIAAPVVLFVLSYTTLGRVSSIADTPLPTTSAGIAFVAFVLLFGVTAIQPSLPAVCLLLLLVLGMMMWTRSTSVEVWRPDLVRAKLLCACALFLNATFALCCFAFQMAPASAAGKGVFFGLLQLPSTSIHWPFFVQYSAVLALHIVLCDLRVSLREVRVRR